MLHLRIIPFLIVIQLFAVTINYAQTNGKVNLSCKQYLTDSTSLTSQTQKSFQNLNTLSILLKKEVNAWQEKGFLCASIDSQRWVSSDLLNVYMQTGQPFKWAKISCSENDKIWLRAAGIKALPVSGTRIAPVKFSKWKEQVLTYAENNGYPFATIGLDSLLITADSLTAKLHFEKNEQVRLDSIIQKGKRVVHPTYLYHYLGLKPDMLYDESAMRRIEPLLNGINFITVAQSPQIVFLQQHALLQLYLLPKPANRFNFLLGLLPSNSNTSTTKSSFLVSGEGDMHLENMQNSANELNLNFKLYPNQTKQLHIDYLHPYLFNFPFGTDALLDINKYDSTYIDIGFQVGVRQLFKGNDYIRLYLKNTSTQVIYIDTNRIRLTHQLPAQIDAANRLLGLELRKQRLDDHFNPSKGFQININFNGGVRTVAPNSTVIQLKDRQDSTFNFSTLYDSIARKKAIGQVRCKLTWYKPIYKRWVLKLEWNASKKAGAKFFANEADRIGGFKALRGFDELVIPATAYSIQTAELHYLLGTNSFAYLFTDYAYTEFYTYAQQVTDHPYGFGAGLAFETKAGIFELNYAYGARDHSAIQWRSAKIHFGYLVQF